MDRYERNIKQIEDAGKCPSLYFAEKTQSESVELVRVLELIIYNLKHGYDFGDIKDIYCVTVDELYGEIADVLNCIKYLKILLDLDEEKIARIMCEKVDRGYERGVE